MISHFVWKSKAYKWEVCTALRNL